MTRACFETPGMLPARYVLVLTNLCNLDCRFCFQDRKYKPGSLTLSDWIRFVDQLPSYARVTLTGGEPLAFKYFDDIFTHVADRFDCNMISNGLLLNEARVELLLSKPLFRTLSISIDNVGNTIRDVRPNQWDKLVQTLSHFVDRRNELGLKTLFDVKTVVLDDNAEQLFDIHRYCVEVLRCDSHAYQFLKGSAIQHSDVMVDESLMYEPSEAPVYQKLNVIREELERVRRYNVERGAVAFMHPNLASLTSPSALPPLDELNRKEHAPHKLNPCMFPWSSVHINNDGNLFPCMAISMGNVKVTPLKDIIFGEGFEQFRKVLRERGTVECCNRCGWIRFKDSVVEA